MSGGKETAPKDDEIPSCTIFVDKEGQWFHHGAPIVHRDLIALFYQSLHVNEDGQYFIRFKGQVCRLDVEDTPYVIVRTDFVSGSSSGEKDRFVLHLIDNTKEELDPETLWIGPDHVMYCRIRHGRFKARFLRASYYQLARYVSLDPETEKFFLRLGGRKYYIRELTGPESNP